MQVGETEAQSVKCLAQAQPPLVGWWWIQPVDVLHGTMFGPITAACSPRVLSSEPLKAARLPVITLSGPLTNLKAWPLTRGEDPRAVLWRTGRGQRVFSEETGRWQPPLPWAASCQHSCPSGSCRLRAPGEWGCVGTEWEPGLRAWGAVEGCPQQVGLEVFDLGSPF